MSEIFVLDSRNEMQEKGVNSVLRTVSYSSNCHLSVDCWL